MRRTELFKLINILGLLCLYFASNAQDFIKTTCIIQDTIDIDKSWGVCWIDYNNDDYDDIFISNIDANHRLYKNNGDATFQRISDDIIVKEGGIEGIQACGGASWADFDNDGDLDCFVALWAESLSPFPFNKMYINNGDGTFTKDTVSVLTKDSVISISPAWVDYDRDGALDLYVTNHDTYPPSGLENASLYKNVNNSFVKIAGLNINNNVQGSNHASWADFNMDGYLDLFTPSHPTHNCLFENNGDGTFDELSSSVVMQTGNHSCCGAWGDYDNDGDLDLLVTRILTGNNDFFRNDGNGVFTEVNDLLITNDGMNYGTASWIDFNNDGYLDVFMAGWSNSGAVKNKFYKNNGNATFSALSNSVLCQHNYVSSGAAWSDYNKDGYMDLFLCTQDSNVLFTNTALHGNNWIGIKCIPQNHKPLIGTSLRIKAQINGQSVWQMRQISAQASSESQHSMFVNFGLADASAIDTLIVYWSFGSAEMFTNITTINQYIEICQGSGTPMHTAIKNLSKYGIIIFPNPASKQIKIKLEIKNSAKVKVKLEDFSGKTALDLLDTSFHSGMHELDCKLSGFNLKSGNYIITVNINNVEYKTIIQLLNE